METVYCPRSEDIQMGVIEEEELNKYKSMVSKLSKFYCLLFYYINTRLHQSHCSKRSFIFVFVNCTVEILNKYKSLVRYKFYDDILHNTNISIDVNFNH